MILVVVAVLAGLASFNFGAFDDRFDDPNDSLASTFSILIAGNQLGGAAADFNRNAATAFHYIANLILFLVLAQVFIAILSSAFQEAEENHRRRRQGLRYPQHIFKPRFPAFEYGVRARLAVFTGERLPPQGFREPLVQQPIVDHTRRWLELALRGRVFGMDVVTLRQLLYRTLLEAQIENIDVPVLVTVEDLASIVGENVAHEVALVCAAAYTAASGEGDQAASMIVRFTDGQVEMIRQGPAASGGTSLVPVGGKGAP